MTDENTKPDSRVEENLVVAGKIGIGFIIAMIALVIYVMGTLLWFFGNP